MNEFNYKISELDVDFYKDTKVDVSKDDELLLEIDKIDNSMWLVQTSWIEDDLILIKKELADELVKFLEYKIKERHNTELPVILHPNFFMSIDTSSSN
ncbi:hypothetical protein UMM65_16655 [Aureibaculum sp. 2210JD6-5]|uniref:hypothetical protein n=1 Tax=Aureibaculum sp. 2210JD6-5 TaxID=3103957 RepID=UPI002AAE1929|nr:hypothetical protein [Aureibaculum sp. 2210JD6-5]MDY7396879.1 hypothetical protein [Aureibaculum sp. 2210JD6-5]